MGLFISPKLILLLIIFKTGSLEFGLQRRAVYLAVLTEGIKRGIVITQEHVDCAEKDHGIFGKLIHTIEI